MGKKEPYILMHEDDEVLSFSITSESKRHPIEILDKLTHFEKAPLGIGDNRKEENDAALFHFFDARRIPETRWDYNEIIHNLNVESTFDLVFKGHGLSLSNHYWFKKPDEHLSYKDINFFINPWDDRFAKAVLSGRYEELRQADLNVPDVLTPGWSVKGWRCEEDGPRLYKMGIAKDHYEEPIAEALTSSFAQRMLAKGEAVEYALKEIQGKYASVSKPIIGLGEELIALSDVLPMEVYALYRSRQENHNLTKAFFAQLDQYDIPGLKEFFVKIACFRSLCFANDLHFDNLSVIRNNKTRQIRLAPLFDFGSSFGSSQKAREFLSKLSKGSYVIIYFLFGDLDPSWDYSWYHPENLVGFEDDIVTMLSKSEFYTPELIRNIIDVYHHQKATLDALAGK